MPQRVSRSASAASAPGNARERANTCRPDYGGSHALAWRDSRVASETWLDLSSHGLALIICRQMRKQACEWAQGQRHEQTTATKEGLKLLSQYCLPPERPAARGGGAPGRSLARPLRPPLPAARSAARPGARAPHSAGAPARTRGTACPAEAGAGGQSIRAAGHYFTLCVQCHALGVLQPCS